MNSQKTKLKLDWCSHEAAEYACKHWHYSKTLPRCKLVKIGVWEDDNFIGVVIFSWGATNNLVKPYGLKMIEGCELTRVALNTHKKPVSRILSISFKFLKRNSPGLKLVVSFADPFHDHHGGIYQATNWIYAGETPKSIVYKDKRGKIWHARNVGTDLKKRAIMVLRKDCEKIVMPPKHRYLMPLDKELRKRLLNLSQPYPKKRVSSSDGAASGFQSEEGGSSPTDTLHVST